MKKIRLFYIVLYYTAAALFVLALTGGSVSKPLFNYISGNTLEYAGVRKSNIDSLDDKIDNAFYSVSKIQLQIDKLKNIFSDDKPDESKYRKDKHELIAHSVYYPLSGAIAVIYRTMFFLFSLTALAMAVIVNMINTRMDLKRRIGELETKMSALPQQ